MCSTLPGDSGNRSCQAYCRLEHARRHCLHCTCSSCSFCSHSVELPPPPTTLERLQHANLSRHAVTDIRRQFLGNRGVVLRLWECSLAGCLGKVDEPGGNAFLQQCIKHEVAYGGGAQSPPASLLRWDLPAAIFAGGRCVRPVGSEWELYKEPQVDDKLQRMDRDGWQPDGFVGHSVTQMGVGWVLGHLHRTQRSAAFPHDAWTAAYQKSGTSEGAGIAQCATDTSQPSDAADGGEYAQEYARDYANRRHGAMRAPPRRRGMSPLQRFAAAYKWGVVNSSTINCFHWHWEAALTKQRAYALLFQSTADAKMARRVAATEDMRPECSIWDSLYNQVHVAYNLSHIRAIFYVNDTATPHRLPKQSNTAETRERLHRAALEAAEAALAVARATQRLIKAEHKVTLPIVQYFFTADCFDAERLATRLSLEATRTELRQGVLQKLRHDEDPNATFKEARKLRNARIWGDAGWTARNVFREPPEPLLPYFGEFFGRPSKSGKAMRKAAKARAMRLVRRRVPAEYQWLLPEEERIRPPVNKLWTPPRIARRNRVWARLRRDRAAGVRTAWS